MEEVLKLLSKANLKVNLEKCHFAQTSIKVLGHIVSEKGLEPNPETIQEIVG